MASFRTRILGEESLFLRSPNWPIELQTAEILAFRNAFPPCYFPSHIRPEASRTEDTSRQTGAHSCPRPTSH